MPANDPAEDAVEDQATKGKYIIANTNGTTSAQVPIVVRLPSLTASQKAAAKAVFDYPVSFIGILKGADFEVASGVEYALSDLGLQPGNNVLYAYGKDGSIDILPVTFTLRLDGEEDQSDVVNVAPVRIQLDTIRYSAVNDDQFFNRIVMDNGTDTSLLPEWKRTYGFGGTAFDPVSHPIVYQRGATMVAERRMTVVAPSILFDEGAPVKLFKGVSVTGKYQFLVSSAGNADGDSKYLYEFDGITLVVRDDAQQALENFVQHNTLTVDWQVSLDGGLSYSSFGSSENELCTLLDTPLNGKDSIIYHTSVQIAARAAQGSSTESSALVGIWSEFADRSVYNAEGSLMKYDHAAGTGADCLSLIQSALGRCGSWARLLQDVLQLQGIESDVLKIENDHSLAPDITGFHVENITPPVGPLVPYDEIEVKDGPAQGSGGANYANKIFLDHAVVWVALRPTQIFDPSYGKLYDSGTSLEATKAAWEDINLVNCIYHFIDDAGHRRVETVPASLAVREIVFEDG